MTGVDGLDAAADALARRASRPAPRLERLDLVAVETGDCVAVDGSHAVLADTGAAWVVAVASVAVRWPGPPAQAAIRIHASGPADAQAVVDHAWAVRAMEAPRVRSAEAWAEALRVAAEAEAALAAIDQVGPGALLLLDGATEHLPPAAAAWSGLVRSAAADAGVAVAAVAKRSTLEADGVPLQAYLSSDGGEGLAAWRVPGQSGSLMVRLHPRAPHVFRVDADLATAGRLVHLARDAAYLGYPYPLAVAHNAVALTAGRVADLKASLETAVRRRGGDALGHLADFHDTLDRNVQ